MGGFLSGGYTCRTGSMRDPASDKSAFEALEMSGQEGFLEWGSMPAKEVKVDADDVIQAAHSLQALLQSPPAHLHLLGVDQHPLRLHHVPLAGRPLHSAACTTSLANLEMVGS